MSALPDVVIADVIVVNANVYTVDPDRPRAQALAISGEFIITVGSNEEVGRLAGRATRLIDAGGRLGERRHIVAVEHDGGALPWAGAGTPGSLAGAGLARSVARLISSRAPAPASSFSGSFTSRKRSNSLDGA